MKLAAMAALAAALAAPVAAETLRFRSGEHDGFSRIVVDGADPEGWSLRRTSAGYVFRSKKGEADYDLGGVFDRMSRRRVADLRARADGGFDLIVRCACHAIAFATAKGSVAIDVRDGPAPKGSPFEAPDAPATEPEAASPDGAAADFGAVSLAAEAAQPDGHLPTYWRPERPAEPPRPVASEPGTSPALPADLPVSDRAGAVRSDLLQQLSRAAAQGLVRLETPAAQIPAPVEKPTAEELPAAVEAPPARRGVPLRIQTSVDRDADFSAPAPALATEGEVCPPDADFAVADWGTEAPPATQIADLRTALLGEFDRPDHGGVIALARFYVHIGFGAEARAALDAFGIADAEAPWLRALAAIVDLDGAASPALRPFTGCAGNAALWSLLGSASALAASDVDAKAVSGAFSALPLHLRRQLGPTVVDRLIAAGHLAAAQDVRGAMVRAGNLQTPAGQMTDAALSLAAGDTSAADETLTALATRGGAEAAEALSRVIRLKLDRGEAVPTRLAENAAALAQELRLDPRGPELAALQILALASTGDFATALAEELRWRDYLPERLAHEVLNGVFAAISDQGDDWTLVSAYFRNAERLARSEPDLLLRLDLAERLTGAGFDRDAGQLLPGEAAGTERGRRLLARHALNAAEPVRAIALLQGLASAEATALRSEAYLASGKAREAQAEPGAGDAIAGRAAWMAGDWVGAARLDAAAYAQPLAAIGLTGEASARADATEGQLAKDRQLVEEAAKARIGLAGLLDIARLP